MQDEALDAPPKMPLWVVLLLGTVALLIVGVIVFHVFGGRPPHP